MKRRLAKMRGDVVAALDVGTTKTCCYIAQMSASDSGVQALAGARILGTGHHVTNGMRAGVVVDIDAVEETIRRSVHFAEKTADETVSRVYVSLGGGNPQSQSLAVELRIDGRIIESSDLQRIVTYGQSADVDADRQLVHSMPVRFEIDGTSGVRDPCGMTGQTFAARIHRVTASAGPMNNLQMAVQRCHLDLESYVVAPYASGLACLVKDEMELGGTVIDMGGGTTSIAVFFGGHVMYTDIVPVGGNHVTSDIARGLLTPIADAERLKTLHGSAMQSPIDDREVINARQVGEDEDAPPRQIQKSMLIRIIQPRLEEILEQVKERLETSGYDGLGGGQVVLTGGASQLPGMSDLAQRILGKQVRIGYPFRLKGMSDATFGPSFSTCAGLLAYAVDPGFDRSDAGGARAAAPSGMLGRVGAWLKENL